MYWNAETYVELSKDRMGERLREAELDRQAARAGTHVPDAAGSADAGFLGAIVNLLSRRLGVLSRRHGGARPGNVASRPCS
jgi:hypothetical protein